MTLTPVSASFCTQSAVHGPNYKLRGKDENVPSEEKEAEAADPKVVQMLKFTAKV